MRARHGDELPVVDPGSQSLQASSIERPSKGLQELLADAHPCLSVPGSCDWHSGHDNALVRSLRVQFDQYQTCGLPMAAVGD